MKCVIILSFVVQCANAVVAALCSKNMISLLFSIPVGMAMSWLIGDSLEKRRIVTRHHGVIYRSEKPLLYWFLMMIKAALWVVTIYFPWGSTL